MHSELTKWSFPTAFLSSKHMMIAKTPAFFRASQAVRLVNAHPRWEPCDASLQAFQPAPTAGEIPAGPAECRPRPPQSTAAPGRRAVGEPDPLVRSRRGDRAHADGLRLDRAHH